MKPQQVFSSRKLAALAGVGLLAFSAFVLANSSHMRGHGGDLFRMEHMAQKLDLSESQREQFEQINKAARAAMKPYVRQMVQGHDEMGALVKAETFDEAAVRAVAAQQNAAMTEMMVVRARQRHQLRALLTPEQREKSDHQRGGKHKRHH